MNQRPSDEPSALDQAVLEASKLEAPQSAVDRLIAANSVPLETPVRSPATPSRRSQMHLWRWAAIAASVAAILLAINFLPANSNRVFANMQEIVANAKTIQYTTKLFDADDKLVQIINSSIHEPGKIRQEFKDGIVVIADLNSREAIELNRKSKTARQFLLDDGEVSALFFSSAIDVMRGTENTKAKQVDKQGSIIEYEVKTEKHTARIFVDEKTKRPVKAIAPLGVDGLRIEASVFVFDQQLDPSRFDLTPPAGFELIEKTANINAAATTEASDTSNLILSEDGLSDIKFGLPKTKLIETLGEPTILGTIEGSATEFLNYHSRGIQIQVEPTTGVTAISCLDASVNEGNQTFAGSYKGSIKIGDSLDDVTKRLGKPDQEKAGQLVYKSSENSAVTSFQFNGSKLSWMSVVKNLEKKDE